MRDAKQAQLTTACREEIAATEMQLIIVPATLKFCDVPPHSPHPCSKKNILYKTMINLFFVFLL